METSSSTEAESQKNTRTNRRYVTVSYTNVGKNAMERILSSKRKCDGYMIASQVRGCVVKLYRQKKYHFVTLTPAFLKISGCRGIVINNIEDEDFEKLDEGYIVDGGHYVKQLPIEPILTPPTRLEMATAEPQTPATSLNSSTNYHNVPEAALRALVRRKKVELGLEEENIKEFDKETLILLLS